MSKATYHQTWVGHQNHLSTALIGWKYSLQAKIARCRSPECFCNCFQGKFDSIHGRWRYRFVDRAALSGVHEHGNIHITFLGVYFKKNLCVNALKLKTTDLLRCSYGKYRTLHMRLTRQSLRLFCWTIEPLATSNSLIIMAKMILLPFHWHEYILSLSGPNGRQHNKSIQYGEVTETRKV